MFVVASPGGDGGGGTAAAPYNDDIVDSDDKTSGSGAGTDMRSISLIIASTKSSPGQDQILSPFRDSIFLVFFSFLLFV